MATQSPADARAQASQQRLNDRTHSIRSARTARELRLGREIVDDLSSLLPPRPPPALRKEEPRGGIPAARGYAERNYQPGNDTATAGIASPLTEVADTREYYDVLDRFYSNTYLIFVEIQPLKALTFTDSNGLEVRQEFSLPPERNSV